MAGKWFGPGYRALGDLERIEQTGAGVRLWAGPAVVEVQARTEHVLRIRAGVGEAQSEQMTAFRVTP